jgi:hypothetical protein
MRPEPCAAASSDVPVSLRYLLESFVMTPALVVGRHTQIIGWNQLAVAVFGDFPAPPHALAPAVRRALPAGAAPR